MEGVQEANLAPLPLPHPPALLVYRGGACTGSRMLGDVALESAALGSNSSLVTY